jgi:ubiquinone/menaquinone biosynthesis C-methylase UbiE
MTRLPVADTTCDAIIAYHSLIHVPADDHQSVIDEFARVLRPGGRVLVSEGPDEWEGTNPNWLETGTTMEWYIAGAAATRAQLARSGFSIEREHGAPNTLAEDDEASWVFFDAVLDSA